MFRDFGSDTEHMIAHPLLARLECLMGMWKGQLLLPVSNTGHTTEEALLHSASKSCAFYFFAGECVQWCCTGGAEKSTSKSTDVAV